MSIERPSFDIILGRDDANAHQYGVFATVVGDDEVGDGRRVAFDLNGIHSIAICALPGFGKTFLGAVLAEMGVMSIPGCNHLENPFCAIFIHYSEEESFQAEYRTMNQAMREPGLLKKLRDNWGLEPQACPVVRHLVPPGVYGERVAELRVEAGQIGQEHIADVVKIQFGIKELDFKDWMLFLGTADATSALYVKRIKQILKKRRNGGITIEQMRQDILESNLPQDDRDNALTRLESLAEYVHPDPEYRLSSVVQPGHVLIADLRDPSSDEDEAFALVQVLLSVLSNAKRPDGQLIGKLFGLDECHNYMGNERLVIRLVKAVRLMRKRAASIIFQSQEPDSVPLKVLEMARMTFFGKTTASSWYRHYCESNNAYEEVRLVQMRELQKGQFYCWSLMSDEPVFSRRPVRLQIRPSVTHPGGITRTVTGKID